MLPTGHAPKGVKSVAPLYSAECGVDSVLCVLAYPFVAVCWEDQEHIGLCCGAVYLHISIYKALCIHVQRQAWSQQKRAPDKAGMSFIVGVTSQVA